MRRVALFVEKFGWLGLVRLFVYPLTVFLITPVRLVQSLWSSRRLANGDWKGAIAFTARNGLQSLFYLTAAENIQMFGRRGRSPYIGLGDYPLSKWFHYCILSLLAYSHLTPIIPIIGMFVWLGSHVVWTLNVPFQWVLLIMVLAGSSTSFYANLFVYQNYNVLGWMCFPVGLHALINGKWAMASVIWFVCAFVSVTVVAIAGVMSVAIALVTLSIWPLLVIAPAALKLSRHLFLGGGRSAVVSILKSIGFKRKAAKYRYSRWGSGLPFGLSFEGLYFAVIYVQFLAVTIVLTKKVDALFVSALLLGVFNAHMARFADSQSIVMVVVSVGTAIVVQTPNWLLLASYWILISPIPLLVHFPYRARVFDIVPVYEPFSASRLVEGMERFLAPVGHDERVLMAFDDPGKDYEKVFDGYRVLLELPLYVASRKHFHFMPDWWGVFELNYEGAPDFWGRDCEAIVRKAKRWGADYVVIYQPAGSEFDPSWDEAGFRCLSRFSWRDYEDEIRGETLYLAPTPDWWLMKVPPDILVADAGVDAMPARAGC